MKFWLILLLFYVIIYLNQSNIFEYFSGYQIHQSFVPCLNSYKMPYYPLIDSVYSGNWWDYFIPNSNGYTDLPWYNTPLGNKRNMSYDLRSDPFQIPKTNLVWNNGTTFPIYNYGL